MHKSVTQYDLVDRFIWLQRAYIFDICISEGVTEFYGMEVVFSNYHMLEANLGFRIIDPFQVYFVLKSSHLPIS